MRHLVVHKSTVGIVPLKLHSFVDLVKDIFSMPGVKDIFSMPVFLSERLSQDPLEKFSVLSVNEEGHMKIAS